MIAVPGVSASNVIELIDKLTRDPRYAPEVLFLDCAPEVLERRFNETRRRHPLSPDAAPAAGVRAEIDLLQVEKRIRGRVKKQMERSQREYYLNEQMKAIQKELGDIDEGHNEVDELKKRIENAGLSKDAYAKAQAELNKLKQMSPMSAEATVVRT